MSHHPSCLKFTHAYLKLIKWNSGATNNDGKSKSEETKQQQSPSEKLDDDENG